MASYYCSFRTVVGTKQPVSYTHTNFGKRPTVEIMQPNDEFLEKAAANIAFTPIFEFEDKEIHVVCLLSWSPPLVAHWYSGKQASILAVDVDGNFFLRLSGGAVSYWNHAAKKSVEISPSVREFVSQLRGDTNGVLEWWKRRNPN